MQASKQTRRSMALEPSKSPWARTRRPRGVLLNRATIHGQAQTSSHTCCMSAGRGVDAHINCETPSTSHLAIKCLATNKTVSSLMVAVAVGRISLVDRSLIALTSC
jgi:hypothetical protein